MDKCYSNFPGDYGRVSIETDIDMYDEVSCWPLDW